MCLEELDGLFTLKSQRVMIILGSSGVKSSIAVFFALREGYA